MILVDANILLYAYDASSCQHARARYWWEDRLSESAPVFLTWSTILAFIRIGTHPRVFDAPLSIEEALAAVDSWLERPMVEVAGPTRRHWQILRDELTKTRATGNLTTDAHLAALAMQYGAILCSSDGDFARFQGITWHNPLVASA